MLFQCPNCSRPLDVADDLAGQEVECPECGVVNVVPAPRPARPPGSGTDWLEGEVAAGDDDEEDAASADEQDAPPKRRKEHVDAGLPLWLRAALVEAAALVGVALAIALGAKAIPWVVIAFVYVALLAGSFSRVGVVRPADGPCFIKETDFVALIPVRRARHDPREHEALVASYDATFGPAAVGCGAMLLLLLPCGIPVFLWFVRLSRWVVGLLAESEFRRVEPFFSAPTVRPGVLILLTLASAVPAVVWWLYASRRGTHRLELKVRDGGSRVALYAGTAEGTVERTIDMIQRAHYLTCERGE